MTHSDFITAFGISIEMQHARVPSGLFSIDFGDRKVFSGEGGRDVVSNFTTPRQLLFASLLLAFRICDCHGP